MLFVLFSFTIRPNCNEMFVSFLKVSITVCSVLAVINISPAYAEHCFKRVDMVPLSSSCFRISSITIVNTVADNGSSCNLTVTMHKTGCGGSRKHGLHPALFQLLRSSTNSCATLPAFFHNANRPVVGLQSTDHVMGPMVFVNALPVHQSRGILTLTKRSTVRNQTYTAWCITGKMRGSQQVSTLTLFSNRKFINVSNEPAGSIVAAWYQHAQ